MTLTTKTLSMQTLNFYGQSICKLQTDRLRTDRKPAANTGFASGGVTPSPEPLAATADQHDRIWELIFTYQQKDH